MNDKANWHVARLEDIEPRGRDIPVREHLGIRAFGINAFTPGEDGTLINEHDEAGSGQEELYIVLDGKATFEVDGESFDAPQGTLVFVRPKSSNQNEFLSLLKQTRQQARARNASWISWRRS